MRYRGLTVALVVAFLAPVVLVASGGDPRTAWSELARIINGGLYANAQCGTFPIPFGGSHTGVVLPIFKKRLDCENAVLKNYSTLVKCVLTCHRKKADALFHCKDFDVDACDAKCRSKYDEKAVKIADKGGCPPCLNQAALANDIINQLDSENQRFYCQ